MLYRVYLWKKVTSQEAEIVRAVVAESAELALQAVMQVVKLSYAHFAWVVPDDEELPCLQRTAVRCSSARRPGH